MIPPRSLFTVFCDVVRVETSKKLLFVGTYTSAIIVDGEFPATLPSLCIASCVVLGRPSEQASMRLELPGAEVLEAEVTLNQNSPGDSATNIIQLIPVVIPEPGHLRFRLKFGDGTTHEASIRVVGRKEHDSEKWPSDMVG